MDLRDQGKSVNYFFWILVGPCLLIVLGFVIFPLLYSLVHSFYEWNIKMPFGKSFVGLGNYKELLLSGKFWISVKNTLIVVGSAVTLELVLGLITAVVIAEQKYLKDKLIVLLCLPVMVAPIVVGIIWRMLYHPTNGLINYMLESVGLTGFEWLTNPSLAIWSIVITDVWHWFPFMFLLLYAGYVSLPQECYEAARIDGANTLYVFVYITLPLLTPTIMVATLLRVIDAFKLFGPIWVMTGGGPGMATETLPLFIYRNAFKFFDMGYAMAMSYFLLITVSAFAVNFIRILGSDEE